MGIQLLDGDWTVATTGGITGGAGADAPVTSISFPSARQQRWTAFRSWYRGGRVFDRAHEALIAAVLSHRIPLHGSQGRPLTSRMAPTGHTQPAVPASTSERKPPEEEGQASLAQGSMKVRETAVAATEDAISSGEYQLLESPAATSPSSSSAVDSVVHVMTLKASTPLMSSRPRIGETREGTSEEALASLVLPDADETTAMTGEELGVFPAEVLAQSAGLVPEAGAIAPWEEDVVDEVDNNREETGEWVKMPSLVVESGSDAAKRLRMEARRNFLAARTLTSKKAAHKVDTVPSSRCRIDATKSLSLDVLFTM